jgi:hypothetical protein
MGPFLAGRGCSAGLDARTPAGMDVRRNGPMDAAKRPNITH